MRKLMLAGLCVLLACVLSAATDSDTLTVSLDVDAVGPFAYFTDSVISSAKTPYPEKKKGDDKELAYSSGNGASGSIYATIITNQTELDTTVTWTDLSSDAATSKDIPLSVTCSKYYVNGDENTISSTSSATEQDGDPQPFSLPLPKDGSHGTRAVSYELQLKVEDKDYLAADAATGESAYKCTMTLSVSAS